MKEDGRAVLPAHIWPLPIQRCRIMHLTEDVQKLFIRHFGGIKGDLHNLSMPRLIGADIFIRGIRERSAQITNCGITYSRDLPECGLDSPEAAGAKCSFLHFHSFT